MTTNNVQINDNSYEHQYLNILRNILNQGIESNNRTGVNTLSTFTQNMKFDLNDGFPILTTKKTFMRGAFYELKMFLNGITDTKFLENKNINYWKGNTSVNFLTSRGLDYLPEGELGCGYSHQIRNFSGEHPLVPATKGLKGFDQLAYVVDQLKNNPTSRRILMSYWCPNQLEYMALPACHLYYQWVTNVKTKELSCFYLCRSNDWFLGKSQNDIMASLLTHYLAKLIGYTVKYLSYTGVDVHLYTNHIDQAKELIKREPRQLPELVIKKDINTLDDILNLEFDDIELINYNPYPVIKASMVI